MSIWQSSLEQMSNVDETQSRAVETAAQISTLNSTRLVKVNVAVPWLSAFDTNFKESVPVFKLNCKN